MSQFFIFLRYKISYFSGFLKFLFFYKNSVLCCLKFKFFCLNTLELSKPFFGFFAFSNVYFDFISGRFGLTSSFI